MGKEDACLDSLAVARKAVEIAEDRQGEDIVLLDIRGVCTFADYFVLCSGETARHLQSLADELDSGLSESDTPHVRREGNPQAGWVLMDFGDVIVHLFSPPQRAYYRLEELWKEAIPLVRIQ